MSEIEFYQKPTYIKQFSTKLRKEQTEAEQILRERLRWKKCDGLRFHRQKALFVYREEVGYDRFLIADFYHHPQRLVIEIDGGIHNKKEVRKNDKLREELLEKKGYTIIRFKNEEVFADIELVLQKIKEKIKKIKSPAILEGLGE